MLITHTVGPLYIIEALKSPRVEENDLADEYCKELEKLHKLNSKGVVILL